MREKCSHKIPNILYLFPKSVKTFNKNHIFEEDYWGLPLEKVWGWKQKSIPSIYMMPPNFLQIHFRVETFYPHHTFLWREGKRFSIFQILVFDAHCSGPRSHFHFSIFQPLSLFYLSDLGIWCSLLKSQEPQPLEIQPELRVKISELFFHNHHKKTWCRKCIFADFILFSESDARGLWSHCMFSDVFIVFEEKIREEYISTF